MQVCLELRLEVEPAEVGLDLNRPFVCLTPGFERLVFEYLVWTFRLWLGYGLEV